jgi:hypothetical protein
MSVGSTLRNGDRGRIPRHDQNGGALPAPGTAAEIREGH